MSIASGMVSIVFNGEIFNFKEIRGQLETCGRQFETGSDTEVLLAAYLEWGVGMLEYLQGQFAFALWDESQERLWLVRDRLGIKPLYYAEIESGIVFASEPKSLLLHHQLQTKPCLESIASYLSFRYPIEELAWFDGIQMLPAGHQLVFDAEGTVVSRYWDLPEPASPRHNWESTALCNEIRTRVVNAIREQMISDVPLGSYLSGGLDSSIIAATNSNEANGPVHTYTVSFREAGFDEAPFARLVAKSSGTVHHVVDVTEDAFLKTWAALIQVKDAPLGVPNEVALHLLSKRLKEDITVVLSGEGADEVFCGYGRIFRSPDDFECPSSARKLAPEEARQRSENLRQLYPDGVPSTRIEHFLHQYSYTPLAWLARLLGSGSADRPPVQAGLPHRIAPMLDQWGHLDYGEALRRIFLRLHVPGLLLRADNATMGASVEARVPFLDHRLVEWVLTRCRREDLMPWRAEASERDAACLNSHQISEVLDDPKGPLRDAFKDILPREVVERKKMGFPVPLEAWLTGGRMKIASHALLDSGSLVRHGVIKNDGVAWLREGAMAEDGRRASQVLWMLMNLEIWYRLKFDGQTTDELEAILECK